MAELEQAELGLQARYEQLQQIYDLATAVNQTDDLAEIWTKGLATLETLLQANAVGALLCNEQGVMQFQAWRHLSVEERRQVEGYSPWTGEESAPCSVLLDVGESAIAPTIYPVDLTPPQPSVLHKPVLCLPLHYRQQLLGQVLIYRDDPRSFAPTEVSLAETLVSHLAIAVARQHSEAALQAAEAKYRSIFENAVEGIYQTNLNGEFLIANPMLARTLGYASPEQLRQELNVASGAFYVEPGRREKFVQSLRVQGAARGFESQVYRRDGSVIWIQENASVIRDAQGEVVGFEGTIEDISARKRDQELIEYMAYYDLLTTIPNRILFHNRLTLALAQARRYRTIVAVLFLDVDRFKTINDTLGHGVGDLLITQLAQRLQQSIRDTDTVARWGGDEFTILLTHITAPEQVNLLVQRLLEACVPPFFCQGRQLYITCSLGVALYPNDGRDGQTLLKNADTALYRAKQEGRSTFRLYSADMNAQAQAQLTLENDLRQAQQRRELLLYYQPQLDALGRWVGVEALLRWQHPRLGLLSPQQFGALAVDTGMIAPIDEWVLREVCRQGQLWRSQGMTHLRFAVNVSTQQFQQPHFTASVEAALQDSQFPADQLEIEITEGVAMDDSALTVRVMETLRQRGVRFAIDDFGTGYSSIGYLKRFPFDTLKLDKTFTQDLTANDQAAAIAQAVINLGHSLSLDVVAEGVETPEQLQILHTLHCDVTQGYWHHRPLPADQIPTCWAASLPSPSLIHPNLERS